MERILTLIPKKPLSVAARYSITAIIVGVSCILQFAIHEYTGFTGYFLLLPGIFLCGFLFDRGSGFVATFISVVLSIYLLMPLDYSLRQVVPLVLFVVVALACAVVSEGLRKALEQIVKEKIEKEVLLNELAHRTKNNLMNISALLHMQARAADDRTREALISAADRVMVMADVHDYLDLSSSGRVVWMERYLEELCHKVGEAMRGTRPIAIRVKADNIQLPDSKAVPIAIITNELLTNCFKYAYPKEGGGTIDVTLHKDGEIILQVQDDGVGCDTEGRGLGSRLMRMMTQQMGGTLERINLNGCTVTVRIPKN